MIYLYAGLGIAMISGISAMMQIGVNLIAIERLFPLKDKTYNEYYLRLDQQIMKILYTPSVPDSDICDYVKDTFKDEYKNPEYKIAEDFDKENGNKKTFSKGKLFTNACALESLPDEDLRKHRVLIIPTVEEEYKYGLFSCIIPTKDKKNIYCDFEINPDEQEGIL